MKKFGLFVFALLVTITLVAQPNTEVYLYDFKIDGDSIFVKNQINISNNEGYDNQPSFYDDDTIIFSSTRNGQTDIRQYEISTGTTKWLTATEVGSEYSPLRIPNSTDISAIRLDTTDLQRLYCYNTSTGKSQTILEDALVGYHLWYDKNTLVNTVLVEDRMDLVINRLKKGKFETLQKNVGRSLLRIPNSNKITYVQREGDKNFMKTLDLKSNKTETIVESGEINDFVWISENMLMAGLKNQLVTFSPENQGDWQVAHSFDEKHINNISRLAINAKGDKLVLVAEVSPEAIVEKQLEAYNNRDIDAFLETYSEDITLFNYPNQQTSKGKMELRKGFESFFETTPDLHCEIKNRIVTGNKVIDEEYLTVNGRNFSAVAIYEIENGKIAKVTFIQ